MADENKAPKSPLLSEQQKANAPVDTTKANPVADANPASPIEKLGPIDAAGDQEFHAPVAASAAKGPTSAPTAAKGGPTKRIILNRGTVHTPGPGHAPFKIDANGTYASGKYVAKEHLPGMVVELDANEADELLRIYGGREVGPDEVIGGPQPTIRVS